MDVNAADVIVIGAGAAGLTAAARLGARNIRTIVLEARSRVGGRILSEHDARWPRPIELGAEFIHGGGPALWAIMRAARLRKEPVADKHWLVRQGARRTVGDAWERIDAAMKRIGPAFRGSFGSWLRRNGGALDSADRALAVGFVEGFQGAPIDRMSAWTLFEATKKEEEQFRIEGGYDSIVDALMRQVARGPVEVRLSCPVSRVDWTRGGATIFAGRASWKARAVLVTVPLGVLRAGAGEPGSIRFRPTLKGKRRLWRALDTGHAVRLVLRMRADVWRRGIVPREQRGRAGRSFGFIHSSERFFPVWWAEAPSSILVGWTGGPAAAEMASWTDARIFREGRTTLASLLGRTPSEVAAAIVDWRTHNWTRDPFARGAYSFSIAGQEDAPTKLARPVAKTLFFAGEATADPLELGTVHGAMASGERATREILAVLGRG